MIYRYFFDESGEIVGMTSGRRMITTQICNSVGWRDRDQPLEPGSWWFNQETGEFEPVSAD